MLPDGEVQTSRTRRPPTAIHARQVVSPEVSAAAERTRWFALFRGALQTPIIMLFAASATRALANFGAKTTGAVALGPAEFGLLSQFLAASVVISQFAEGAVGRSTVMLVAGARGRDGDGTLQG